MQRKRKLKNKINNHLLILLVIIISFLFAPFVANIGFNFDCNISFVDILGMLTTIILALYLANIIEKKKSKDKADNEMLISMISNLISKLEITDKRICDSNISYLEASALAKSISSGTKRVEEACLILCLDVKLDSYSSDIKKHCEALRKRLTTISDDKNDLLKVKENIIIEIGIGRMCQILSSTSKITDNLYQIWIEVNNSINKE